MTPEVRELVAAYEAYIALLENIVSKVMDLDGDPRIEAACKLIGEAKEKANE